jgi:AraC-like DNA-binding protein
MTGKSAAAVSLEISFDQLDTRPDVVRQAAGQLHRSPVYGLLRVHMARLCATMGRPGLADASPLVADATRQLARAVIISAAGPHEPGRRAIADVLYERVAEYVVQHLAEPDLTPDRIAAAHNISLRHLYRLWGRNETGLAEWIVGERLAGAAHDLRDPAAAAIPVAAVARKWGFTDPAHFSRRFRRAYAMSPREWRHAQLAQDPDREIPR